jgi:hypothetical protein
MDRHAALAMTGTLYEFKFHKKCGISITILDGGDTSIPSIAILVARSYGKNRSGSSFCKYFWSNKTNLVVLCVLTLRNLDKVVNYWSDSESSLFSRNDRPVFEESRNKTSYDTFTVSLILSREVEMFFYSVAHTF